MPCMGRWGQAPEDKMKSFETSRTIRYSIQRGSLILSRPDLLPERDEKTRQLADRQVVPGVSQ
jgi:hypothetical protein